MLSSDLMSICSGSLHCRALSNLNVKSVGYTKETNFTSGHYKSGPSIAYKDPRHVRQTLGSVQYLVGTDSTSFSLTFPDINQKIVTGEDKRCS